jgi:hypothetical protein
MHQEVIMVVHQTIGMELHLKHPEQVLQQI